MEWKANRIGSVDIVFLVVLDWMSIFFVSSVALISRAVMLYSNSYIKEDDFIRRFILLLFIFILRIWILILRPNFIRILLGWDGLGVTSYLLVIYFQREKSFNSGIITALTNRLGDVGLLIIIGVLLQKGSWSFCYYRNDIFYLNWLIIMVLTGVAITKRAQIPFSSWLPAAMAAPTPVSSLVHSSTLVTAGVYLLIRLNYFLLNMISLWYLLLLGLLTIIIAGRAAIKEVDIKKIIALSTLRQLGFIFITLGIGVPLFTFFHLVAHAYFKAILFICSGNIIHRMKSFQDLRRIGGALIFLPVSSTIFFVANLRLCGIPFITGFYSKDLILELLFIGEIRSLILGLSVIATLLTVAYSVRVFLLVFLSTANGEPGLLLTEGDGTSLWGILILLLPSIAGGLLLSWIIRAHNNLIYLPNWLKLIIIIIILVTPGLYLYSAPVKNRIYLYFLQFIWFMPFLFRFSRSKFVLRRGKEYFKITESGWGNYILLNFINSLGGGYSNYFSFWFKRHFLKRIIFLLFIFLFINF